MNKVVGIENLNPRKVKSKEYVKMAEECLCGNKQIVLEPEDFFKEHSISQRMFDDSKAIYVNPTEKLIIGDFVKEGDNFATVLGSGDFALDGVFHGAREVTTFDINRNQFLMAELKTKGLQKLSYDDFWALFSDVYSDSYLSSEIYRKIKAQDASDPLFAFWDVILKVREQEKSQFTKYPLYGQFKNFDKLAEEDPDSFFAITSALMLSGGGYDAIKCFNDIYFDLMMISSDPSYKPSKVFKMIKGMAGTKVEGSYIQDESSYLETCDKLKKSRITFLKSDLAKLRDRMFNVSKFKNGGFEGFNSIYLSNIPEYMNGRDFFNIVSEQLMPLLTDDGSIVYCCQGVDPDVLENASPRELLHMIAMSKKLGGEAFMNAFQEINNVEGYQALREQYDVSKTTTETLALANGNADTDVFVRVKKK